MDAAKAPSSWRKTSGQGDMMAVSTNPLTRPKAMSSAYEPLWLVTIFF